MKTVPRPNRGGHCSTGPLWMAEKHSFILDTGWNRKLTISPFGVNFYSGIGLALVSAVKGYKTIITLPEKMSAEKVSVLKALNATIIRTPTEAAFDSPESHIGVARRLQKELPNAHILDQYGNPDNPLAHELGTAEEIWNQTRGKVTAVVAGAGTGGTITGLARGLRKHNQSVKIIAADPQGSILALPSQLNEEHANSPYKVEGIGYDFIPDVLDQGCVDKWYKTDDRESFHYARRLIAEEGLLVGGSSGSALAATVKAARELGWGKDDVVVVVLPDSIRSYLTKFADDDWLAANDLLPPTPPGEAEPLAASPQQQQDKQGEQEQKTQKQQQQKKDDQFSTATVRSLRLKPVQTIPADSDCASAIEVMREKGFDQLPVLAPKGSRRLVGLVTLGNLLSRISHGRATGKSPVSEVMFDFTSINEVVTDPRDVGDMTAGGFASEMAEKVEDGEEQPEKSGDTLAAGGKGAGRTRRRRSSGGTKRRDRFVEITMDTPLSALNRFFEWQSAAIVTERNSSNETAAGAAAGGAGKGGGGMKPVAVVTKVDLLTWMLSQHK